MVYGGVVDVWSILALQLVALVGGAVTGAAALFLGGAGSLRVLTRRMELLEELADHTADRVTHEVKKRAGQASAEKRERAASAEEQAAEVLAAAADRGTPRSAAPRAAKRPSVVSVP